MAHDELYEESLIQRLNEVERTREWLECEWLECELREVRNRLQRKRNQQKDVVDWSGDAPKFNNIGEWLK